MKIKSLMVAALATSLLAVSCSKTEEGTKPVDNDGVGIVTVTMGVPSKAVSDPVTDGTALKVNDGYLFFSNATGQITMVVRVDPASVGSSSVTDGDGLEKVGVPDLATGVSINKVPKTSTTIDFYGNLPGGIQIPPVSSDIDAFRNTTMNIRTQFATDGGVGEVSIYGTGTVVEDSNGDFSSKFESKAVASRIEIEKFVADDKVEGFDIVGIFVNHFYVNASYTGTGSNLIAYTQFSDYSAGGETYYGSTYNQVTYDYDETDGLGAFSGLNYSPAGSKVWAYNTFSGNVPHIVVKLANIEHEDDQPGAPKYDEDFYYITVTGFEASGVALTAFERGYIYNIGTIKVNDDTLNEIPEPDDDVMVVEVEMELIPWKKINVDPIIP